MFGPWFGKIVGLLGSVTGRVDGSPKTRDGVAMLLAGLLTYWAVDGSMVAGYADKVCGMANTVKSFVVK